MRFVKRLGTVTGIAGLLLAAGLAISAYSFAHLVAAGGGGPRAVLVPESRHLDLGAAEPGATLRGQFVLRNTGWKPLEFDVQTSCGCTELSPRKGIVPARGAQTIALALELPAYSNAVKEVNGIVRTNDPASGELRFGVTARCPAPFSVSPAHLDFGSLGEGETPSHREIQVESAQSGFNVESLEVKNASEFIRVDRQQAGAGRMTLRVELTGEPPKGDLFDAVEVALPGTPHLLRVPVHARNPEPLSVAPSLVVLRRDSTREAFSPILVILAAHRSGLDLEAAQLVDPPSWIRLDRTEPLSARRCRVLLAVSGRPPGTPTDLTFTVNGPEAVQLRILPMPTAK